MSRQTFSRATPWAGRTSRSHSIITTSRNSKPFKSCSHHHALRSEDAVPRQQTGFHTFRLLGQDIVYSYFIQRSSSDAHSPRRSLVPQMRSCIHFRRLLRFSFSPALSKIPANPAFVVTVLEPVTPHKRRQGQHAAQIILICVALWLSH